MHSNAQNSCDSCLDIHPEKPTNHRTPRETRDPRGKFCDWLRLGSSRFSSSVLRDETCKFRHGLGGFEASISLRLLFEELPRGWIPFGGVSTRGGVSIRGFHSWRDLDRTKLVHHMQVCAMSCGSMPSSQCCAQILTTDFLFFALLPHNLIYQEWIQWIIIIRDWGAFWDRSTASCCK